MRLTCKQLAFGLVCLLGAYYASAAPPVRIHGKIATGGAYTLPGNVHRIPLSARDTGLADSSLVLPRITLHLGMTPLQQSELQALLSAQQTPGSGQYHQWLTPEQFGARFGANDSDIQKISAWLEDQGFSDIEVARGRNAISFSGTAQQVEMAFGTTLHRLIVNGTAHYANLTDPVLPAALKGVIQGIRGLNDFRPRPQLIRKRAVFRPHFTSSITGNTFLSPGDFATIYNVNPIYNSGLDGSAQTIAVAGQSDIQLSDIEAFRSAAGLPSNDPEVIVTGTDPGTNSGDESEADLDLEWAGAIAKNAHIVYVNSKNAFTSVDYAVQNNLADVLVISYGTCESSVGSASANSIDADFQQANAQGMTVVAASGDDGAADCDEGPSGGTPPATASQGLAVDFPASSAHVTGIGGTTFNEGSGSYWQPKSSTDIVSSALSYIPEVAWNDSGVNGYLSASGGGASSFFPKPSWQAGQGVPSDGKRDVPDVSFSASPDHDGYLICSSDDDDPSKGTGGKCVDGFRDSEQYFDVVGGTSAGVPAMGGIVALLDQQLGGRQGNINAKLYTIASVSSDAFHDITQGNNIVNCTQGTKDCPATAPFQFGYSAGPAYDQATGLGSIDAYNLLREWNMSFELAANPQVLTVTPGASASAAITVTPSSGFNGTVSFTCTVSSGLVNTTCSVPGTVTGSGSATLTVTAGAAAAAPTVNHVWILPSLAAFAGFCLVFILARQQRRVRVAVIAMAGLSLAVVSCGGGGSGGSGTGMALQSVAENGTVTVTGTAGIMTQTTTISVSVP